MKTLILFLILLAACSSPAKTEVVETPAPTSVPVEEKPHTDPALLEEREMILLGTAETFFKSGESARASNVRLATSFLDQVEVLPGEEFSFNDTVGHRTAERGFKMAPTILLGELVDDLGGGTCQVSSTLFNAVMDAQLTITERRSHSRVPKYLPAGRDATVSFPQGCEDEKTCVDFRFKNSTESPILIETRITPMSKLRTRLVVEVLGYADEKGRTTFQWTATATKEYERKFRKLSNKPDSYKNRKQKGEPGLNGMLKVRQESPSGEVHLARLQSTYKPVGEIWEVGPAWDETKNPWE